MRRIAALALFAVLAGACTFVSDDEPGEGTSNSTIPPAASVLRVAAASWPDCLNPLTCTDDPAHQLVFQHVLPRLLEVDDQGRYVPSPVLAGPPSTRVDEVSGEQVITYRIDEAARWHDGRPVTSTDVRGTWLARMRTPGVATALDEAVVDVDDRDPLVAVVTLERPHADWRELFGGYEGWLLQADAFGTDLDLTGKFRTGLPFGAGPFELVSFGSGQIVLAARELHWEPSRGPGVDRVQIERIEPGATVPSGVDVVLPDVVTDAGTEATRGRLEARWSPTTEVVGLFFDQRTPALADRTVRHAIDLALDRRHLLSVFVDPEEATPSLVPCLGWLPTDPSCDDDLPESDEDAVAADALFAQGGWTRTATGERVGPAGALAVPVTFDPELPRAVAVADALRFRLRVLGVDVVDERPVPAGEWRRPGREESTGVGVFAVELGSPGRVADLYTCGDGVPNRLAWCTAELSQVLARLGTSIDDEERSTVAAELGDEAAEAFAWLPLHQRTERWLVAGSRVTVPPRQPLGAGPLGALHDFARSAG